MNNTSIISSKLDEAMVLVQLRVRCWTGSNVDSEATSEFVISKKAEAGSGAFKKTLIEGHALKALVNEGNRARRLIYNNALPWIGTAFILPVANMAALKERLDAQVLAFNQATDEFVSQYETLKIDAKRRLGSLYSEADYPSADVMRDKFSMNVYWQPVGATHPSQMKLVDDLAETVANSARQAQGDAVREAKQHLGACIKRAVIELVTSLENYERRLAADEKPILKAARVEALDSLYDMVAHADLDGSGDNEELGEMIRKLKDYSVEELRTEQAARKAVLEQCEAIKNRMAFWN